MKSSLLNFLFIVSAAAAHAQIHAPTPERKFETASVKPLGANERPSPLQIDQQRFVYASTLFNFIFQAFHPQCAADCSFQGAPAWLDKDRFSIEATLPEGIPAYSRQQFMRGDAPELSQMLQALLADRFQLKTHWETRTLPVYEITVARAGPKLPAPARSSSQAPASRGGTVTMRLPNGNRSTTINVKDSSVEDFAKVLDDMMDHPVLDRTGLKGTFDFTVQYESEPDAPSNGAGLMGAGTLPGPSMFKAMEEQLGLTMKATKGAIEVLVIDHLEALSQN